MTSAERVTLDEVFPFRRSLLRPPGHVEPPKPGDLHPRAAHFVARRGVEIMACASVHPEPLGESRDAWQLRGVATAAEARRRGFGRAVVEAAMAHARAEGASVVWCHARVVAIPFYERLGFAAEGPVYELPVSGPHRLMRKS